MRMYDPCAVCVVTGTLFSSVQSIIPCSGVHGNTCALEGCEGSGIPTRPSASAQESTDIQLSSQPEGRNAMGAVDPSCTLDTAVLDREGEVHERGARLSLVDRDLGLVVLCAEPELQTAIWVYSRKGGDNRSSGDLGGEGSTWCGTVGLRWCDSHHLMEESNRGVSY